MIEVCLKVPNLSVFIGGNINDDSFKKKISELFCKPDINLLVAKHIIIKQDINAPYNLDFEHPEKNCVIFIPVSNIACIKNVKEA